MDHNKRQFLYPAAGVLLGAAAALLLPLAGDSGLVSALTAPGLLLGRGLRQLSLSGWGGNLAAWAIVLALSLLPLLLFLLCRRKTRRPEDWLLCLMAPGLLALLYHLVNPELLRSPAAAFFPLAVGGALLALLAAWIILRALSRLEHIPPERLGAILQLLLVWTGALVAFAAVFSQLSEFLSLRTSVLDGNTAQPSAAGFTVSILALLALLKLIPELLGALVLLWGGRLALALGRSAFDEQALALCDRTALGCRGVVRASALLMVLTNLLQLALFSRLTEIHMQVDLPLLPLLLSAGLFLLCRCLRQGKALQDDNASII